MTEKHPRKARFFRSRRVWSYPVLCLLIAALIAVNLLLGLGVRRASVYPDLTTEGLYTVSEEMRSFCRALTNDVTVLFCRAPDRLLSDDATRYVYILASELSRVTDRVHVEWADIARDPTAVYPYRTTSATEITDDSVIVSCEGRYRIMKAASFYTVSYTDGDGRFWSFDGEYKLATAILSVSTVAHPSVCFTYGHGERLYVPEGTDDPALPQSDPSLSAFWELMESAGLRVEYLDPSKDEIPDDCALVVIFDPAEDFTDPEPYGFAPVGALDRLHAWLVRGGGALMLFKSPLRSLPELEQFAAQWGAEYLPGIVRDKNASLGEDTALVTVYNTAENEMSSGVYADLSSVPSPPRTVVPSSGAVKRSWETYESATSTTFNVEAYASPFLYSSPSAMLFDGDGGLIGGAEERALAMLSARIRTDAVTSDGTYSYFFASASPDTVTNDLLTNSSLGNRDVMFSLVRYLSRTDRYASMSLGGHSVNSSRMGGKPFIWGDLSEEPVRTTLPNGRTHTFLALTPAARTVWTVLVIALPTLTAAAAGVWIHVRRKHR